MGKKKEANRERKKEEKKIKRRDCAKENEKRKTNKIVRIKKSEEIRCNIWDD